MHVRFDMPSETLVLMTDRRDALSLMSESMDWTEHWMRVDDRRVLELLHGIQGPTDTAQTLRYALAEYQTGRLDDEAVIALAAQSFSGGWAVRIERHRPINGWQDETPPPTPVEDAVPPPENPTGLPEKKEKDHFITIELIGENGEPIPNELCRITTSDGTVIERETDSAGKVHEYGIVEGDCEIEFPDLDKDAWEPVS